MSTSTLMAVSKGLRALRWAVDVVSVGVVGYVAAISDWLGLTDEVVFFARALLLVALVLVVQAIRKHGFDAAGLRMVASTTYAVTAMVALCFSAQSFFGLLSSKGAGLVLLPLSILTIIHIGSVGSRVSGPFAPATIALGLLSGGLWLWFTFLFLILTLFGD